MSLNYKDMITLSMMLDSRGYVAGGRSIINTTSLMGRSFIYAQTQTDHLTDKMLKSNKVISESEMIQKKATSELVRYASAASAAGVASYFMFNKIKGAVREASTFQKSLLDINVAMGNVGDNFSAQRSNALVKSIKNVQSNIYNLNEAAQAYFIVSSAGLQGTNRMGKDITELGVHYAKLYHTLSRGKVTLEQAANFIPELIAKTGASMEIQFNNGQTQMERYLDMMGKAEVITKIKMENMRDIIDSTGASWRNLGVSFAAGLAMVGTQMTAGQSARTAGQSAKALFNKFQTDIALLGSQEMLNDPTDKLVKDLDKLNRRVLKYQNDIAKAYGGTAQFQAVVNGILTGKLDAKSETNRLIQMHQSGKISAKAFNQMADYFKGLSALDGDSLKGTKQQRRLLLGLSMLYGDGEDYTNKKNIEKGRETYEKMITEVKAGNMSVNELLKELGTKLEAIEEQGGSQGIYKSMLASKLLFSETTSHTAFLNTLKATAVANQDVYLTDKYTGERIKSLEGLSFRDREKYQKMIAEGLAKETAKGILLYREGQRLKGADALLYTEYATRDSQNLASKTFEANMKLFSNRLKTISADLKTVSTNIGEGFLAPISGATSVIQGFTSSLSILTNNSKGLSSLLGSFAGSIVTVGTVMATVMGVKALSRLGGGAVNFLGLPTKSGEIELNTAKSNIESKLGDLYNKRDSLLKKSQEADALYLKLSEQRNKAMESIVKKHNVNAKDLKKDPLGLANDSIARYNEDVKRIQNLYDGRLKKLKSSPKTSKKLQQYDKDITNLEVKRDDLTRRYNTYYASQSPIMSSFRELNKAIPETTKGFKKLGSKVKNFGVAFKTNGGLGGVFNRGYYNMMGSPAAMMTTMVGIALGTWGLSRMKEHNMFGMQNILGDSKSGRVNYLEGWLNRGKTRSKHLSGERLTWDDLLPMISNKDEFDKWKDKIIGTRNTYTDLISKRGKRDAGLQVLVNDIVRRGEFTEGEVNTLWTREFTRLLRSLDKFTDSGYTLKDKDGKYIISDSKLLTQARKAGFNEYTIGLLQGNTSGFRSDLDRLKDVDAEQVEEFNKGYNDIQAELQRLAKMEQDPWGYNLYKWFTSQGDKYLGAIAAGVGFGAISGQLFGNAGLGALIAGVGALLTNNVTTLFGKNVKPEDKAAAIGSIVSGTSMAGILGGAAVKMGKKFFPHAMMGYLIGDTTTKILLDIYTRSKNKIDATKDLLTRSFKNLSMGTERKYDERSTALEYVYDNKIVTHPDPRYVSDNFKVHPHYIEAAYGRKFFEEELTPFLQEKDLAANFNTGDDTGLARMAGRYIFDLANEMYEQVPELERILNPDLMRDILDKAKSDLLLNIKLGGVTREEQERIVASGGGIDSEPHDQQITNDFIEQFVTIQRDLTDAQLESVRATEALTKQLKDTEDVWFFDINQGFYDSKSYKPGDKSVINETDSVGVLAQGKSGSANTVTIGLTAKAEQLLNVEYNKVEGDLVLYS